MQLGFSDKYCSINASEDDGDDDDDDEDKDDGWWMKMIMMMIIIILCEGYGTSRLVMIASK